MNEKSISRFLSGKTLRTGVAVFALVGSAAALGKEFTFSDPVVGEIPEDWFVDTGCRVDPITESNFVFDGVSIQEFQVDVSAVANDGDPDTFARCVLFANDSTNRCIVGLPKENPNDPPQIAACRDLTAPHALPHDGDMLYLTFFTQPGEPPECEIFVGSNARFGEADPNCRDTAGDGDSSGGDGDSTGDGDGSNGGGAAFCNVNNAIPVTGVAETTYSAGQCYSADLSPTWDEGPALNLHVGHWNNGEAVNLSISSSDGLVEVNAPHAGWTDVNQQLGTAVNLPGEIVYFTVDRTGLYQIDVY